MRKLTEREWKLYESTRIDYEEDFNNLKENTTYYEYSIDWYNEMLNENEDPIFFYSVEGAISHAKEYIETYDFDEAYTEDAKLTIFPFSYNEDYEEWEVGDVVYKESVEIEGFYSLKIDMAKDIIYDIVDDVEQILLDYYKSEEIETDLSFSRVSESSYINIKAGDEEYKLRVSTHQLPDKYEQPDLEIRFDSSFLDKNNELDSNMVEQKKQQLYRNFNDLVKEEKRG